MQYIEKFSSRNSKNTIKYLIPVVKQMVRSYKSFKHNHPWFLMGSLWQEIDK